MCLQGRKVTPVLLPLLSGTQVLNFTSNVCYLILQPLQRKKKILALLGVRNRLNICPSTSLEEAWKGITDANNMQSICIYNHPPKLFVCKSGGLLLHKYSHQSKQFNKERKVTFWPLQIMLHMQHCVCSLNYKVIAAPISQKVC